VLILIASTRACATIVRFDTVLGTFDVRLFDTATPLSVANLLNYVNDGDYDDSFIHRSLTQFVIQGGGFTFESNEVGLGIVPTDPPVMNEPGISNIRSSMSFAKQGPPPGQPPNEQSINSATSGWFVSLNHNTANLDNQNGGFTVFGIVLGNGMAVVDAIAALPTINASGGDPQGVFANLPVRNFSGGTIFKENLAIINSVTVVLFPDGDYNFDGVVDGADLNIWDADYGRLVIVGGDFNDDNEINSTDLAIWESGYGQFNPLLGSFANYTDGDTDGDADVDGIDFLNWQRGAGGTTDVAADGDGSAQISGDDFLLWQRNYGPTMPPPVVSLPEPAPVLLVLLGLFAKSQALRDVFRDEMKRRV
jgi:peptidyl-prolyl cis-trans isomerase A (cyclophilin A)